jgi:hypothetical protein
VNSTPLSSTKPVNGNMSFGTGFAFPYDNVPLNSISLLIALLFLWSQGQGYVLFAGFTVPFMYPYTLSSLRKAHIQNKTKIIQHTCSLALTHTYHTKSNSSTEKLSIKFKCQHKFNPFTAEVAIMRLPGSAPMSHLCDQKRKSTVTGLSDLMTLH